MWIDGSGTQLFLISEGWQENPAASLVLKAAKMTQQDKESSPAIISFQKTLQDPCIAWEVLKVSQMLEDPRDKVNLP